MLYRGLLFVFVFINTCLWSVDLSVFDDIKNLYERYGNDKYMINEEITQRSHVLQAALIANLAEAPEEVVIALLLHDIGQITSKDYLGDLKYLHAQHDELGAKWLAEHGFPDFVCDIVRFHTAAKVVLCIENTDYFDALSQASKESYFIQRDKYLNEIEHTTLKALLNHSRIEDIKHARRCDDMAKIISLNEAINDQGTSLPSFDHYYEMFLRVCQKKGLPGKVNWKETICEFYNLMIQNRDKFELYIKQIHVAKRKAIVADFLISNNI